MMVGLVDVLALVGAAFTLIAAFGIVRFPKTLWRMHAAAKAGTLGAGLLLAAVAVAAPTATASRVIAAVMFLLLTAPVAAHTMARRAERQPKQDSGAPQREAT